MRNRRQNRNNAKVGVGANVEKRRIVLASSSPRRRELLERAGVVFMIEPPDIEEDMQTRGTPAELVKKLALKKALVVAARHRDAIIVAADTIVAFGSKRWSKPESKKEARMMLRALSGKWHDVWTSFCILDAKRGKRVLKAVKTAVKVRNLARHEIERYIKTGEPLEGAGGYKMQGAGGFIFEYVRGDYNNILGLPLSTVLSELKKLGV